MLILITLLWICWAPPIWQAQEPSNSHPLQIVDPVKFDEWGDILFSDEKARLHNAALYVQKQMPRSIIYLVIYAGQKACVGEAKARGVRAKKYLTGTGIPAAQVVWIDGGHRREVTTEVWIWPAEVGKPSANPTLNANEITLEKNCKIKRRASRRYSVK